MTVSKIFILSHAEVFPTLNSFIAKENIPKHYGGELDFNWGEMPNLDPKIRELATWENGFTEFPKGPVYWKPIDGGKRTECVAVGTVDKNDRNTRVCTIPVAFADEDEEAPAATNGALEAPASTTTGADETQGLENLTLIDTDEKTQGATVALSEKVDESEAHPNGKPVTAA